MDIQFNEPFEFQLDVVEVDDHVPSLRAHVHINMGIGKSKLIYDDFIWIECEVWDRFLKALRSPPIDPVSLYDMDEHCALSIHRSEQGVVLTWNLLDPYGFCICQQSMTALFTAVITEDAHAKIREAFEDFPSWW
ncbi:hypothetical protein [Paludibacterium purpuratum]|uniref:hypothetical protein n=1 Tax=Paludibacterium purpuratum TaxID=1144873 RepID=UPI0010614EF9|nr:hypothetical protein [Paludibacterium purpuratum]